MILWLLWTWITCFLTCGKSLLIITDYGTHLIHPTNFVMHRYTVNTSQGLFRLLRDSNSIAIKKNNSGDMISLADSQTNQILHLLCTENDKSTIQVWNIDLNNPKVAPIHYEEHRVTYHQSFSVAIQDSVRQEGYRFTSIATVVYKTCPKFTTTTNQNNNNDNNGINTRSSITPICFPIKNLLNLTNIKDFIAKNHFSHMWLLLSPLDVEMFLSRLRMPELGNTRIITTMLSDFQFHYFTEEYPYLELFNLHKTENSFDLNINENIIDDLNRVISSNANTAWYEVSHLLQQTISSYTFSPEVESIHKEEEEEHEDENEVVIRVTTVIFPPYVIFVDNEFPDEVNHCARGRTCYAPSTVNNTVVWKYRCCDGLSIQLFHLIAKGLGLKYRISLAPDGSFGAFKNGQWNGMIRELVDGKADIAIQGIEPTNQRMQYVRFTEAYMYTHYVIVRRGAREKPPIVNWRFVQSLETSMLISILVSAFATTSFVYFAENIKYIFYHRSIKYYFPSREIFTYITGLTFQRDTGGKNPVNWSGRIVALGYAIAMTIVMSTYAAHLTANTITNNSDEDFDGITDQKILEPSPSFKFAVVKDTSQESYFINHPSSRYAVIWNFMKDFSVKTTEEGVMKVFNGELDAFISDDNSILPVTSHRKYCSSLTIYNELRRQSEVTFSYRKDFRYGPLVSELILQSRQSNNVDNIKKKWIYIPSCQEFNAEDSRYTWMYCGGMLLIIGGAVVTCIFILILENIYGIIKGRKRK